MGSKRDLIGENKQHAVRRKVITGRKFFFFFFAFWSSLSFECQLISAEVDDYIHTKTIISADLTKL